MALEHRPRPARGHIPGLDGAVVGCGRHPPPGLVDPILSAVVDGFTSGLECQVGKLEVIDFVWDIPYATPTSVSAQLVSQQQITVGDCVTNLRITDVQLYYTSWDGHFEYNGTEGLTQPYFIFQNASCNESSAVIQQRIVLGFGEITEGPETVYNRNMSQWPSAAWTRKCS